MAHDILIVDDEEDIRMLTAGILEDEGYETNTDYYCSAVCHTHINRKLRSKRRLPDP